MKKYTIISLFLGAILLFNSSCEDNYLDKSPESGLNEDVIFSKYENYKKFFDSVYEGRELDGTTWRDYNIKCAYPLYFAFWDQKYSWEGMTDAADQGRYMEGQTFKSGQVSAFVNKFTYDRARRPILGAMFKAIRISNMSLQNIEMLKDAKQDQIDDLIAQAHFVRAFCHFELFRLWGPMPYITKVLGPDDEWDIPRLSKHETLLRIAADMDTAATFYAKANKMRRDPGPGGVGHLNDVDQKKPNGVAAKAYKARALLYAASPLNNELGTKDWEEAAKANWEAIQIALQYQYALLSAADFKKNYVGTTYTNEQLWAWYAGTKSYNTGDLAGLNNMVFSGSTSSGFSGVCPTQNFVDRYETKWGEPLITQADRDAATALGHYNEQNPYKDREPRFYIDIIYNQAPLTGSWQSGKAQIYFETKSGAAVYSELLNQAYLGITRTGYYLRKTWGEQSVKNQVSPQYTDPLIRLGELYLNYAEAANEAYGPTTPAPNASMSALDAINFIRARINQVPVLSKYTVSKEEFRPRIKNERIIELSWEGHYYHDIRRWKDAPVSMAGPLIGMDIEKVSVSPIYPTGFKYVRSPLSADRQSRWKDAMYYLPFNTEDTYKMKNFVSNEVW